MMKGYLEWIILVFILAIPLVNVSQDLLLNEFCPVNQEFKDEFNKSPDWIELYNKGNNTLNLSGMKISDRPDFEEAWQFENVEIAPQSHLLLFASGKDRKDIFSYQTIIQESDNWKYYIPSVNIGSSWRNYDYADNSWSSGISGFGYGDSDDNTIIPNGTRAVFLRKKFEVSDLSELKEVLLHVDYDDAFIAYINGVEVARANIGSPGQETPFYFSPDTDHEAQMINGGHPDYFDASFIIPELSSNENIICIQVHNVSSSSSDMTMIPFLTLAYAGSRPNDYPEVLDIQKNSLHTDFKLSSEGESLYVFESDGSILDSFQYPMALPNISYGRLTDGSDSWVVFNSPTPGYANAGEHYLGIDTSSIQFSHASGIYSEPFYLSLNGGDNIRYTVDNSEPDGNSLKYIYPFRIDENTHVRARNFKNGFIGNTAVTDYLLGISHDLPVISLNTESKNLWDVNQGMYVLGSQHENSFPYFGANFWEDWEYPFYINYFDKNGQAVFEAGAGGKIFGGWSRAFDQKSFSLFARSEYGTKSFDFPFFKNRPYSSFESIILRNAGNDWEYATLRDAVMTQLMLNSNIDVQAYQPVVAYLNGSYWGIYNFREKINEHYIASLHHLEAEDIDLIELNGEAKHGSNEEYLALRDFIEDKALTTKANYNYVISKIDEQNFIQYQVAQIYYNNTDWPGNNIRCWKSDDTKWRWIMYDTDFGLNLYNTSGHSNNTLNFALETNGPQWPNPPWSTLFLRKLVSNTTFKNNFINGFADAMNSVFLPQHANAFVDVIVSEIQDEVPDHRSRWNLSSYSSWLQDLNRIKTFFNLRPGYMRNHIKSRFSIPATYRVNTEIRGSGMGVIRLNSLLIETSIWSGIYFHAIPIQLSAYPKPGFEFSHWTGDISSEDQQIEISPLKELTLIAHFKKATAPVHEIVINEINYNSPDDPDAGDWIELFNTSSEDLDLSGWFFKDDNDDHSFEFPENTIIQANGFLVLSKDPEDFANVHPGAAEYIGPFDFGLSSGGDEVRIFDNNGDLVDSVSYQTSSPWPEEANGQGPTLELLSPELDNTKEGSWRAFPGYGTPCAINHTASRTSIDKKNNLIVFPNPAHDLINIEAPDLFLTELWIYNMDGKLCKRFNLDLIESKLSLDISFLKSGQYIIITKDTLNQYNSQIVEKD